MDDTRTDAKMLTYMPATADQADEFVDLLHAEAAHYLDRIAQLMQMTWPQFAQLTKTVGQVYGIYQDGSLVGFYWIEARDQTLHLHGLVVKPLYQGQGIGTQVLNMLTDKYKASMEAIELGVHESNPRARALYERLGYKTVTYLEELGFYIMQQSLAERRTAAAEAQ